MNKLMIACCLLVLSPLIVRAELDPDTSNNVRKLYADRNNGELPPADGYSVGSVAGVVSLDWTEKMGFPRPTDEVLNSQRGTIWNRERLKTLRAASLYSQPEIKAIWIHLGVSRTDAIAKIRAQL